MNNTDTHILSIDKDIFVFVLPWYLSPMSFFCLRRTCQYFSKIYSTQFIGEFLFKIYEMYYSYFFPKSLEDHYIVGSFPEHFLREEFFDLGRNGIEVVTTHCLGTEEAQNFVGKYKPRIVSKSESIRNISFTNSPQVPFYDKAEVISIIDCYVYRTDEAPRDSLKRIGNSRFKGEFNKTVIDYYLTKDPFKRISHLNQGKRAICINFSNSSGNGSLNVLFPPDFKAITPDEDYHPKVFPIPRELIINELIHYLPPVSLFCLRWTCQYFSRILSTKFLEEHFYRIFQEEYSKHIPEYIERTFIIGYFPVFFLLGMHFDVLHRIVDIGTMDIKPLLCNGDDPNATEKFIKQFEELNELYGDTNIVEKLGMRHPFSVTTHTDVHTKVNTKFYGDFKRIKDLLFSNTIPSKNKLEAFINNSTAITIHVVSNLFRMLNNSNFDITKFYMKFENTRIKRLKFFFFKKCDIESILKLKVKTSLPKTPCPIPFNIIYTMSELEKHGFEFVDKKETVDALYNTFKPSFRSEHVSSIDSCEDREKENVLEESPAYLMFTYDNRKDLMSK